MYRKIQIKSEMKVNMHFVYFFQIN